MTLVDIQSEVNKWIEEYGVRYFNVLTNNILLMEEVGELSRILAREYGEQSYKEGEKPDNMKEKIADEMADILFVLTCLSNQMEIDLESAFKKNIDKKTGRDKERHKTNRKLE